MAMMLHGGENQSLELAKLYVNYLNSADSIVFPIGSSARPKYAIDESSMQKVGRGDVFTAKSLNSNPSDDSNINLDKYIFVVTSNAGSVRLPVGRVFNMSAKEAIDGNKDVIDYWTIFSKPSVLEPGFKA